MKPLLRSLLLSLLLLSTAVVVPMPAGATLIAGTDEILDTNTGLLWLPMSATLGLSFDSVSSQPGLRGASLAEMSSLFSAYSGEEKADAFGTTHDGVILITPSTVGTYDDVANEAGALRQGSVVFIDGVWEKRLFAGGAVSEMGFAWMGIWTVVVPEPSTAGLLALGPVGLAVPGRRG